MRTAKQTEIKMNETLEILDSLDNIGEPNNKLITKKEVAVIPKQENDLENVRQNYYHLMDNGKEAIGEMLHIAGESEAPRAYEVVGQLIKVTGDVADKLRDLQLEKEKIEVIRNKSDAPNKVTNNAIFLGSTKELQDLMKKHNE